MIQLCNNLALNSFSFHCNWIKIEKSKNLGRKILKKNNGATLLSFWKFCNLSSSFNSLIPILHQFFKSRYVLCQKKSKMLILINLPSLISLFFFDTINLEINEKVIVDSTKINSASLKSTHFFMLMNSNELSILFWIFSCFVFGLFFFWK